MPGKNPVNQANIERWSGFADIYDRYRPASPPEVTAIIEAYLGKCPETVADIGCGTGLSALVWADRASTVIGIEPSDDMRAIAQQKESKNVQFVKGYSNSTGLAGSSADVVTISQAFHWMNAESTIAEVDRILKPGGVFAVYDCDWPPAVGWEIEQAYQALYHRCDEVSLSDGSKVVRKDKSTHLATIKASGRFRYVREIVFHRWERMNAERMTGILLSQGGVQTALQKDPSIEADVARFRAIVEKHIGAKPAQALFSYRMRIAVKG